MHILFCCLSIYLRVFMYVCVCSRWFGPGRIGLDFRSYQALLTMHVWFLHKRLLSDSEDPHRAAMIQEELFDIFWTDSSNRMRAHGVNEWLINKNLQTVQQYTFMHCFHYDHCYTEALLDNPEERAKELKHLVQKHVLLLNPEDPKGLDFHDDHVQRIAWYIEAQYQNIVHDLPQSLYTKARIAWVDLPDFTNLTDDKGRELGEAPAMDPDHILPDHWIRNIANDGTYYYWNKETRDSQWERPL
jgi:cytochrome b pre-mRNA-processing protein 3